MVGRLRGIPRTPGALYVTQPQSHCLLQLEVTGTSLLSATWARGLSVGLGFLASQGGPSQAAQIPLLIFICQMWVWDQPVQHRCPS